LKPGYGPAIALLGRFQRNENLHPHKNTWIFPAALFTVSKNWKESRCPSMCKWLNESWDIHGI
jgi:hypothetical protein